MRKSELREMKRRHHREIELLQSRCDHPKSSLKKTSDELNRSIHIVCRNCGCKKIIFPSWKETTKIIKTLKRQRGFKDQRFATIFYESELE